MKILKQRVYDGKNIYSHKKCIRLDVDLGKYSEIPSKDIKGFNNMLISIIPELKQHRCGIDEEGGFVKRLNEGTYLAHICEHMIIALHNRFGMDIAYGKAREIKGSLYYIIFQYKYKTTGLEIARLAVDIINSLINEEFINIESRLKIISEILSTEAIGPSTMAIKEAAERYGMPMFQLNDSGFYQIGYGKQGRIIEATIGSQTSCVAADIASDKKLTKEILRNQSIPVADGARVCNAISLLQEGERIGYPVVLKPRYGCKGKGIILNIKNDKELIEAYNTLKDQYKDIIIEKYIDGDDYRVCVVDYNVVAVSLRIPPSVIGDGKNTLKQLIKDLNSDNSRGYDHEKPLTKVRINEEMLRFLNKKGLSLDMIPKCNEKIVLRENANLSTGGIAIDYTDKISCENKEICIRAAKSIGLDICGIDIKTTDISKPLKENGVIMEVNAAPGIRMHTYPVRGKARDVGEAILSAQYNGVPYNIPVISITGTNGKTTTTRLISHVLRGMGYKVGMTSTEGIYIDGKCIDKGDDSGYYSARCVLMNKDVEVAVLETARGGLIRKGLAYDNADVAVITNITEDHIGLDGIENMDDLAFVKSLVAEEVKDEGYVVLNADDEYSKKILERIKAKKIFFSKNKQNKLITNTIKSNGIAVYIDKNCIYVSNEGREYKIIEINKIPITLGGVLEFNIENAMAACGALVGMGIDYCIIAKKFRTFKLDEECCLGRFNIHDVNGVKVILDYGHNIDGYRKVLKCLSKLNKNKLRGIIGVPGDREDRMITEIGKLCAENMDEVYIKEDLDRRGRKCGEVAELLKKGVKESNNKNYTVILNEVDALRQVLDKSKVGDIVIVFYEKIEPLDKLINEYKNNNDIKKVL